MEPTAAAYLSIIPGATPIMAEQPASKPFHLTPTQRTRLAQASRPPLSSDSFLCGGFEFMRSPFPTSNYSATLGHALAPFSEALDCRAVHRKVPVDPLKT